MEVLAIILFVVLHNCSPAKDGVPVFVYDDEEATSHWNFNADPFKKISPSQFADVMAESSKRSACIIIFIEEQLSTEDVALKDALGTPYTYLRKGLTENKVRYVPSVSQPYQILKHLFPPQKSNKLYLRDAEEFLLPDKHLKYFYVSFEDSFNATRIESLRHHDTIMNEVIKKYVKNVKTGPIISIYTGKRNPVTIEKLYSTVHKYKEKGKSHYFIKTDKILLRISGIYLYYRSQKRRVDFTESVVPETSIGYKTNVPVPWGLVLKVQWSQIHTMDASFELILFFSNKNDNGTWFLEHIQLMEDGEFWGSGNFARSGHIIEAPLGRSYYCAYYPMIISYRRDRSTYFVISKYQMEPTLPNVTFPENATFSKSIQCDPYFPISILAGLFVTAIFLTIIAVGIVCIMDIKTNNKYEDPNGPEIMPRINMAKCEPIKLD